MESKREKRKSSSPAPEDDAPPANGSRWQPTKEQIDILEGVYAAGVKTPSAEQIQQITARLSQFGHIEGKNVFYWFQNTKARRRQKQKQDRLAFLSRYYNHRAPPPPIFPFPPPPIPNGYCYYPCYDQAQGAVTGRPAAPVVETLELFPLRPGGGPAERVEGFSGSGSSSGESTSDDTNYDGCCGEGFIDFLSGKFTRGGD